jgi:hypothetical protein
VEILLFRSSCFFSQDRWTWQALRTLSVSPYKIHGPSVTSFSYFDGHGQADSTDVRVHLHPGAVYIYVTVYLDLVWDSFSERATHREQSRYGTTDVRKETDDRTGG